MSTREPIVAEEVKEIISNINVPNIAIIGSTGVGKSTLINSIFGIDLAKTGAGLPITQSFVKYPAKNEGFFPIVIYDSPGYEAAKGLEWVKRVLDFLEEKRAKNLKEQIHLIWYVINASSARVEYFERDILNKITQQHVPAIIVLSQCDRARPHEIKGIEEALDSFDLKKIYSVIKTSAKPLEINGRPIRQPFGLTDLVDKTIKLVPEMYSEAIVRAQIVDLSSKKKLAWQYITTAASACFTAGFIPIPGVTPAAAIASQVTLSIKIASIYGYADFAYFLSTVGTFSISSLSNIFLTATLDLLSSVFPPSRTLSGGLAATFITIIGLTYISVFEKLAKAHIYVKGKEATEEFLGRTFRQEFKKYVNVKIFSNQDLKEVERTYLSEIDDKLQVLSLSTEVEDKQELKDNEILNTSIFSQTTLKPSNLIEGHDSDKNVIHKSIPRKQNSLILIGLLGLIISLGFALLLVVDTKLNIKIPQQEPRDRGGAGR